jgi:predicted metal-dependent HD superfamily phosphohydrolase
MTTNPIIADLGADVEKKDLQRSKKFLLEWPRQRFENSAKKNLMKFYKV